MIIPARQTPEDVSSSSHPILVIDRQDILGEDLYEKLKQDHMVVLIGSTQPQATKNLVYIPYSKKMPKIPNSEYSSIIYVLDPEREHLTLLSELFKKAQLDKSKFALIIPNQHVNEKTIKSALRYPHCFIFVLGDLFGRNIHGEKKS